MANNYRVAVCKSGKELLDEYFQQPFDVVRVHKRVIVNLRDMILSISLAVASDELLLILGKIKK